MQQASTGGVLDSHAALIRIAYLALTTMLAALPMAPATAAPPRSGHSIKVEVVDVSQNVPLAGAQVTLVELSRTTFTNADGACKFTNVPTGEFTLGIHVHGFTSFHSRISVPAPEPLTIELRPARFEEEITVTAAPFSSRRLEVAQQVDVVFGTESQREATASLGQALTKVPGVTNIPTGEGLGTPVIRGLSENRVRILNDGFPLNHQQFSWRHSPNIEASLADRVEVVRGPASVLYGPDAMGGVVNVIQAPLPVAVDDHPVVHGEVSGGWGSNADERTGRAQAEGAVGSFGWSLGLVHRRSDDIDTPEGELGNTDFEQTNGNAAVGVTGEWGTARLRWSHWEIDTGFYRPPGFRLTLDDDLIAGDLYLPTQLGDIEITLGQQTNVRKAFPAPLGGLPAVDLKLDARSLRAGLHHRPVAGWRGRIAVEWLGVDNETRALGQLVPDYETDGAALMLFEEARWLEGPTGDTDRIIVSFGARWDRSDLSVPVDLSRDLPDGFGADYEALTGSLGVVVRATEMVSLAANIGRGWRPPSAFQLFANGVHGGVSAVQMGNRDLKEESNLNAELSLRVGSATLRGYVTAFRSDFDDFIYLADTGQLADDLPVFEYRQADATIDGLEASVEAAAAPWLTLAVSYSMVDTRNDELDRPLPQEPADRWTLSATVSSRHLGGLHEPYVGFDVELVDDQEISGPDEPFGVATDAYELVTLKAGLSLPAGDVSWGLDLTVRNLLDTTYTDFLYSYKAFAANPGRDIRLVGSLRF